MVDLKLKLKTISIRKRLLLYAVSLGLIVGSVVFFTLNENYKILNTNSIYLEHISKINEIYDLDELNSDLLDKMSVNLDENDKEDFKSNINKQYELVETIKTDSLSVDTNVRLRVVKYLLKSLENHASEYIWLLQYEANNETFDENQDILPSSEEYTKCNDTLDRIDAYIQEILRLSVSENKQYLEDVKTQISKFQKWMIVMAVLISIFSIAFNMIFANYVSKLINQIMDMTYKLVKGNQRVLIEPINGPKEIMELTDSFNKLLGQIHKLNLESEEKSRLELKLAEEELNKIKMREMLKDARLQGLQMQIAPHFLFNTLNIISKLAFLENDEKVYELIVALSTFLRHSLKDFQSKVRVEEELDMIAQYLLILEVRMGDRFQYEINNTSTNKEIEIPIFTLQPIVENAFKHGIEGKIDGGKIMVRVKDMKGGIKITVADSGIGMDREKLILIRKRALTKQARFNYAEHIGIENVCCRLNILFQENITYSIHATVNKGTIFTMIIKEPKCFDYY
ncbi:MAG: sensor histidine kinase [Lachnotalea sp.]